MKELNLGNEIYKLPKNKVQILWEMYLAIKDEKERQEKMASLKSKSRGRKR